MKHQLKVFETILLIIASLGLVTPVNAIESADFILEDPIFSPVFSADSNDYKVWGGVNPTQGELDTDTALHLTGESERNILPTPPAPVLSSDQNVSNSLFVIISLGDNDEHVNIQLRILNVGDNSIAYYSPSGESVTDETSAWYSYQDWGGTNPVQLKDLDHGDFYAAQVRVRADYATLSEFSDLSQAVSPPKAFGDGDEDGGGDEEEIGIGGIGGKGIDIRLPPAVEKLLSDEEVQKALLDIAKTLVPLTAIAMAAQLGVSLSLLFQLLANLSQQLIGLLLSLSHFFAFASKRKVFGQIFNGKSKKTIQGAKVSLLNPETKRLLDSQITDELGRYYFLSERTTSYLLRVEKEGFNIFEKVLRRRVNIRVYLGVKLEYDPAALKRKQLYANVVMRLNALRMPLLLIGTASWLLIFIYQVEVMTYLLGGYYTLAWSLELLFRRQTRPYGVVQDNETYLPLSLVVVRIFNRNDKLLITLVSDEEGRFRTLLHPGVYTFRFSKVGYQSAVLKEARISRSMRSLSITAKLQKLERESLVRSEVMQSPGPTGTSEPPSLEQRSPGYQPPPTSPVPEIPVNRTAPAAKQFSTEK